MKNTVIHHSADYDGLFCREVARKFLPPDTQFIGWDYGQPLIHKPEGTVYILDLSPDCLAQPPDVNMADLMKNVIWIDHHKTAIDKWPSLMMGYRIDGVAACRLAYQWFYHDSIARQVMLDASYLPTKDDYLERRVLEPLAVRLAGEYDIWDKRDPRAEWFQFGLDGVEEIEWSNLLDVDFEGQLVGPMCLEGCKAQRVVAKRDADMMKTRSFQVKLFGLTLLVLNIAKCNSNTFASLDVPATGHDALMAFYWDGKIWNYSLYHAKHNTGIDLSEIAKQRGGGGHRGACGFKTQYLIPALTGQKEGPCS